MLVRVAGKDTQTVIDALIQRALKLSKKIYKSLIGTEAKSSLITSDLSLRPISKSTSATRRILGSAGQMKTQTDCLDSISRRAVICRATPRQLDAVANLLNASAKKNARL